MEDKDTGTPADFRNTSGDTDKSVASCGFKVRASTGAQEEYSSEKIRASSKEAAWIKGAAALAVDSTSQRRDAWFQEGPVPGDFGDHKPIPEEAMTVIPLGQDEKEMSQSVQRGIARALGLSLEDDDDDFFIELKSGPLRFTKEEVEDVEYFQKRLFDALGVPEGMRSLKEGDGE